MNDKEMEIVNAVFNNENLVHNIFESLKKELLEIIFLDSISTFKKALFIQGVFTYANLILGANQTLSIEEKEKKILEIVNISKMLGEDNSLNFSKYVN